MKSYSLNNFKSFGSNQIIPIKPITLIYGANSSGKSSIIHGYLFIRELFKTGECDIDKFTIGGELLDIGGFKQYLHKKEYKSRNLSLEVKLKDYTCIVEIEADGNDRKQLKSKAYIFSIKVYNKDQIHIFTFQYNKTSQKYKLEYCLDLSEEKMNILNITLDIKKLFDFTGLCLNCDALDELIMFKISNPLQYIVYELEKGYDNIIYLGPIRSYPTRDISLSEESNSDMDYNAWNIVKKDKVVRDKVNKWLGGEDSKLKTGYELSVKKYLDPKDYLEGLISIISNPYEEIENELGELFDIDEETVQEYMIDFSNKLHDEYDDFKEDKFIEFLSNKYSKQTIEELIIRDLRTDTTVSHRDIGVGISQVLPVLVSAYASKNAIVAIEQPELHLHPALQSEIADVFIETALGENKNTYLIETHSEHLLLRIMKRIRETTSGELEDNLIPINPNDVQILFVMPGQNVSGSVIKKIDLNVEGELIDDWPGGFFEEGYNERFGI